MHSFSVTKDIKPSEHNAAFGHLNAGAQAYFAEELNLLELGRVFGGINKQYLGLSRFSLNPAVALKRMGCQNVDELLAAARYDCGFLGPGSSRYCIVPLGLVVNEGVRGLQKYRDAYKKFTKDETLPDCLHLLPDYQRFDEDVLRLSTHVVSRDGEGDLPLQYQVSRFEQLFAGSGYTREMLAAGDTYMELRPVGLNLTNGDTLLAYAYMDVSSVD